MATLIDASLLIAAERGRLDWDAVAAAQGEEDVAVAAITASELLLGVHRATDPKVRTRRSAFVERVLAQIPVVSFDVVVARVHARV